MEDKDQFIDELLDAALAQQRGAEIRPGLEGRILEHVRTSATERRSRKGAWLAVTAMAAAIVLVIAIHMANRSQSPAVPTPQIRKAVPSPQPSEELTASSETAQQPESRRAITRTERTERQQRKVPGRTGTHHWPSQFPTPAPLTGEQEALVQFVRDTPPQVLAKPILKAEFTVQRVSIKPLKIAPLEIQPLALGSKGREIQ